MKTHMTLRNLIVSALLMVLLTVSGAVYAHDGDGAGKDGGNGWSQNGECHKGHLPQEKRELLHQTMKTAFEQNKGVFDQMRKLHKELHNVLKAETFDRPAFMSLSAQIEKTRDHVRRIRTEAFASIASQFTPEEREMVARHLGHHHHHGHHGGWHHHDGQSQQDGQAYPPYPSR